MASEKQNLPIGVFKSEPDLKPNRYAMTALKQSCREKGLKVGVPTSNLIQGFTYFFHDIFMVISKYYINVYSYDFIASSYDSSELIFV